MSNTQTVMCPVKQTGDYVLMYNMMDYHMMDILMYALRVVLVLHPYSN